MAAAPELSPTLMRHSRPLVAGRKRIVVAMSGGVDSAAAAALLQAEGHDVIGVTLQLYDHGEASRRRGSCCAGQDIHDARRAADHIGIPHYVLDYEKRFEAAVMQSFADSYLAGETPIPCVTCNAQVKFKDLLDMAGEVGADLMATGHYIARRDGQHGPYLVRAADGERDQSYFLFSTTREQVDRLCFPLGDMSKNEVRARAAALGLPLADKPDSQDICFVPTGRYADVIARLRPDADTAGEIVHVDGRVLGRHGGIVNFTVGQRRGLNIHGAEPLFVVRLEPATRRVVVGPREQLRTVAVALRQVNWLGETGLASSGRSVDIHARLRSQQPLEPATLHFLDGGRAIVELAAAEYGISAGQACVFYEDASARARLLGGGWIARAENRRRDAVDTGLAGHAASNASMPP